MTSIVQGNVPGNVVPPVTQSPRGARRAPRFSRPRRATIAVGLIGGIVGIGAVILAFTGSPVLAFAPTFAVIVVYLVWTQPMRRTLMPVVFAQCFFFEPNVVLGGIPVASGPLWSNFIGPGYYLLNLYLNKIIGIGFLSLSLQELIYILLFALMLIRIVRGQTLDSEGRVKMANVLFVFLALEVAAVVALEVYGIARGGNFRSTLFQIRNFVWLPLQTAVFAYALRDTRDFRRLAIVITAATMLKAACGTYFYVKDGLGNNYTPDFITGHTDTVLYVAVLFLWVAAWMHQRSSWQRHLLTVVLFAWFFTAIILNDRRLAWASLVGSFLAFYPLIRGRQKRRVNIGLICAAPFLVLYFVIASKVSTGIFGPGAEMLGMSNVEDTSSLWRVLENQNLVWNLRMHRIFGSGFGHEWIEFIRLPDISGAFEQYRLVAHNSLLWILGISGVFGFTLLWLPLVVGVFLATRSYHAAQTPLHRTAAATVIAVTVCYVNQAWGDIGLGAPLATLLMAIALALAAKLSTETDSWPLDAKLT